MSLQDQGSCDSQPAAATPAGDRAAAFDAFVGDGAVEDDDTLPVAKEETACG